MLKLEMLIFYIFAQIFYIVVYSEINFLFFQHHINKKNKRFSLITKYYAAIFCHRFFFPNHFLKNLLNDLK